MYKIIRKCLKSCISLCIFIYLFLNLVSLENYGSGQGQNYSKAKFKSTSIELMKNGNAKIKTSCEIKIKQSDKKYFFIRVKKSNGGIRLLKYQPSNNFKFVKIKNIGTYWIDIIFFIKDDNKAKTTYSFNIEYIAYQSVAFSNSHNIAYPSFLHKVSNLLFYSYEFSNLTKENASVSITVPNDYYISGWSHNLENINLSPKILPQKILTRTSSGFYIEYRSKSYIYTIYLIYLLFLSLVILFNFVISNFGIKVKKGKIILTISINILIALIMFTIIGTPLHELLHTKISLPGKILSKIIVIFFSLFIFAITVFREMIVLKKNSHLINHKDQPIKDIPLILCEYFLVNYIFYNIIFINKAFFQFHPF